MSTETESKAKESLIEAFESSFVMDSDVPSEVDEEAHRKWDDEQRKKMVPKLPESLGGEGKADGSGLVYLDYTFSVDPSKYVSPNYQPIANAAQVGGTNPNQPPKAADSGVDNGEKEPSSAEESKAADQADKELAEVDSLGKPIDKKTQDEAPKVVLDYATYIDGSSFICFDLESGIDYSKITMDAGAKQANIRPSCKTTFNQCRAKNPLFCRFHGPKLLEKDIKNAISHSLGPGCTVSVTKDKGSGSKPTFRLTVGCPPSMKKQVEQMIHFFMTNNPGISSPEEFKELGGGKRTMEFDMDLLQADKPPKKDSKGAAALYEVNKAKAQGKTMPIVGDTPAKIEKVAAAGGLTPEQLAAEEEKAAKKSQKKAEKQVTPQPQQQVQPQTMVSGDKVFHKGGSLANPSQPQPQARANDGASNNKVLSCGLTQEQIENGEYPELDDSEYKDFLQQNHLEIDDDDFGSMMEAARAAVEEGVDVNGEPLSVNEWKKFVDMAKLVGLDNPVASALYAKANYYTSNQFKDSDSEGATPNNTASVDTQGGDDAKYKSLIDDVTSQGFMDVPDFKNAFSGIDSDNSLYPTAAEKHEALENLVKSADWGKVVKSMKSKSSPTGYGLADSPNPYEELLGPEKELGEFLHQHQDVANMPDVINKIRNVWSSLDEAKEQAEQVQKAEAMKAQLGKQYDLENASLAYATKTLDATINAHKDMYEKAKAKFIKGAADAKDIVTSTNEELVANIKAVFDGGITQVTQLMSSTLWPDKKKPTDVYTAKDMRDFIISQYGDEFAQFAKEYPSAASSKELANIQASLSEKSSNFGAVDEELNVAMESYKNEADEAKTPKAAQALKPFVDSVISSSNNLIQAFSLIKAEIEKGKKIMSDIKAVEAKKKALAEHQAALKKKYADMPVVDKLKMAIGILKKELANNPNDATATAQLKKYEAILAKMDKNH